MPQYSSWADGDRALTVGCEEWKSCQGNSLHLWDDEAGGTVTCTHRVSRPES